MNPQQPQAPFSPQPQSQASIDYLNQIAPQAPKTKLPFTRKQLILLGGLGFAIILVIIIAVVASSSNNKKPLEQLAAILQSTETISANAQNNISDSQLQALNSNLDLYLTNTNRTIAAPLLEENIDVTKLDPSIVSSESGADVTARLQNAQLNAVFDNTYASEISYRLNTIITLMRQINESTNNKDIRSFLDTTINDLEPTQQAFANFNDTST